MQNYHKPGLCNLPRDTLFVHQGADDVVHETFSSHFKGRAPRVSSPEFPPAFASFGKPEVRGYALCEKPPYMVASLA